MELTELAEPPPAADPLAEVEVEPGRPITTGELTLALNAVFTPEIVGSSIGTTASSLVGRFGDHPQHPGGDCNSTELGEFMQMSRVRLGRYRWRLTAVTLDPPRACVVVDRVAALRNLRGTKLADGEAVTFWLSTLGVQDLELEPPTSWGGFDYLDYVQIELDANGPSGDEPWRTRVRARRVLAGYENADWELDLPIRDSRGSAHAMLGDHRIALLAVEWVSESPAEFHAHLRLERGITADGMMLSTPPPAFIPLPLVEGVVLNEDGAPA